MGYLIFLIKPLIFYLDIIFRLPYTELFNIHSFKKNNKARKGPMEFWRVPLDANEIEVTKGIVYIIEDRCKGCGYCIEFCPRQVLEFSSEFNSKGYHPRTTIHAEDCGNCH